MNGIRIEIELLHSDRPHPSEDGESPAPHDLDAWRPGERLDGEFRIANCSVRKLGAAECSILWYTVGKGDEDLHVHALERFEFEDDCRGGSICAKPFSFSLPPSPLSYDGVIVKVRWCVRVRAFLAGGQEIVSETPIVLGDTSSARLAEPISEMTP